MPTSHPTASSSAATPNEAQPNEAHDGVERRELITVCRQMASMMEAGVDILRVTRVLRAQTTNPQLLEFYDNFDHDLRLGRSVADALANAPELFSPFAVSLVQEGEERNDIAGALSKIADFLQSEEAIGEWAENGVPHEPLPNAGSLPTAYRTTPRRSFPLHESGPSAESLHRLFERVVNALAVLLLVESAVAAAVALKLIPVQWWPALGLLLAALSLAGSARGSGQSGRARRSSHLETAAVAGTLSSPDSSHGVADQATHAATPAQSAAAVSAASGGPERTPTGVDATAETEAPWPTAEEEGTAFSRAWQRPAPREEEYD